MAEEFKPGDVVQLKSGGPTMTVLLLEQSGEDIRCVWFPFDRSKGYSIEPMYSDFASSSLMLAEKASNGKYFVIEPLEHKLLPAK
jgi:uncharacterized protein YodC (DUF2158 family)